MDLYYVATTMGCVLVGWAFTDATKPKETKQGK